MHPATGHVVSPAVLTGLAAYGQAEVMRLIANAVTMCRFESTDRASDQVVLSKILQASLHTSHLVVPQLSSLHDLAWSADSVVMLTPSENASSTNNAI